MPLLIQNAIIIMPTTFYHWDGEDLLISLYVQPKASQAGIVGEHNGRLKVKVSAPPTDGKANAEVQKLLAKAFKVAKSNVQIVQGAQSREKQVRIIKPQQLIAYIS